MRFFKKLFGLVSNSVEKNDYARATLEYATSHAIVYSNRGFAFKDNSAYHRAISNYAKAFEINTKNTTAVIDAGVFGLQGQRISVTFYRSFTSTTYRSISYC